MIKCVFCSYTFNGDGVHCVYQLCGRAECANVPKAAPTCHHKDWTEIEGKRTDDTISVKCKGCGVLGEVYFPCS